MYTLVIADLVAQVKPLKSNSLQVSLCKCFYRILDRCAQQDEMCLSYLLILVGLFQSSSLHSMHPSTPGFKNVFYYSCLIPEFKRIDYLRIKQNQYD